MAGHGSEGCGTNTHAARESQAYSIWATVDDSFPESSPTSLKELISNLAVTFGMPSFLPHITLLGGLRRVPIDLLERRCEQVAQAHGPVTVQMEHLETGSTYYQFVYLVPNQASKQSLSKLHAALRRSFDAMGSDSGQHMVPSGGFFCSDSQVVANNEYKPHISLAYGKDPPTPADSVKQIILESDLFRSPANEPLPMHTRSINSSVGTSSMGYPTTSSRPRSGDRCPFQEPFTVRNLVIMDTDLSGPVEQWKSVRVFRLGRD